MFWTGALFATTVAGTLNVILLTVWKVSDPNCNATLPVGEEWPFGPAPVSCVLRAWVEWILTPGIIEETAKFLCLWRLCTTVEEATKSCCLRRCPRSSENSNFVCCGWFLKLAPSPASFVLCGMAVGGGFATLENVEYVSRATGIASATPRLFSAVLHICMTGISSFTLAYALFLVGRERKRRTVVKYSGLVLMMLFHGSYDAVCTFSSATDTTCVTRIEVDAVPGMLGPQFHHNFTHRGGLSVLCSPRSVSSLAGDARSAPLVPMSSIAPFNFVHEPLPLQLPAQTQLLIDCPLDPSDYVCGSLPLVSWFPQLWPPFALGALAIVAFAVVGCVALPRAEREFRRRGIPT